MALDSGGRGGGRRRPTLREMGENFNNFFGGDNPEVLSSAEAEQALADLLLGNAGKSSDTVGGWTGGNGGPPPQKIAPQTVFRPKPAKRENPGDALDALFQQLMGSLGSGGGATIDYESALADSEQAIRDAYANDIQAIRQGNRGARRETARNRAELEGMYNQLAKEYQRSGRNQVNQAAQLGDRMQENSEGSANFLNKNASNFLAEQAATAKNLGIEDAVAESSEPLKTEAMRTAQRIVREGASDANRQVAYGGNNQRFMERGATTARLEGTNRSADLLADLQDFIQQNRQMIAGLKGDRGRELAANESEMMGSVAEMQQAADSEMWDRLMGLAGLKLDIDTERNNQQNDLAKLQASLAGEGPGESMPGAENFANAQHYLSQLNRPKVGTNVFDSLLKEDPFLYGKVQHPDTEEMYKLTPEMAMDMIQKKAEAEGLSQQDINLLRLAIFTQMG